MTDWINKINKRINDGFINVWSKASLVLHTRQLKEDNKKVKHNAKSYAVRECSPAEG